MTCTKKCNAYSWYWWTEWAQFFSTAMPDHTSYNQYFKSWMNWATKFCFICHIHMASQQPNTTSSSISTTLCRENTHTPSRMQKRLSKSSNPKTWFLTCRNKQPYFSLAKNVLIVTVLIFTNKNSFEPSYNDLKIHCLKAQLLLYQPDNYFLLLIY